MRLCVHVVTPLAVTAKLISAFVFATRIVQSLYFITAKFKASSHLLWLYSPVYVGPGRKPRRPVFSERGSYHLIFQYRRKSSKSNNAFRWPGHKPNTYLYNFTGHHSIIAKSFLKTVKGTNVPFSNVKTF